VHGAVLAAVLLGPTTSPPVPAPAFWVELVSEPGGAGAGDQAGLPPNPGEMAATVTAEPAPPEPVQDTRSALAAPVPAREPVAERAVEKPARAPRERPPRPVGPALEPKPRAAAQAAEPSGPTGAGTSLSSGTGHALGGTGGAGRDGTTTGESGPGAAPGFEVGSADNPLPHYPTLARRRGIEGTVTLEVRVRPDGLPERVAIGRSSGSSLLDAAALEAVRRWRFRPARRAGVPVEGDVTVPITFRLVEPERAALR
jgi:protein TonB